jgi:hypothetical protein
VATINRCLPISVPAPATLQCASSAVEL